ncbi:MAG: family 16 glycoside hydrolase [Anaerolineae bacterium]
MMNSLTTVEDKSLTNGEIGLALDLYNAGDKASVDFDNLQVLNLSDTQQETMLNGGSENNGAQGSGEVLFEDNFDSDAKGWPLAILKDKYSSYTATIENGQYTISVKDKDQAFVERLLPSREFDDFVLSIEATPGDTGQNYSYGVSFRENKDDIFYALEIGNDGQYAVLVFDQDWKRLKDWSTSKAIKVGGTNKITIEADGGHLTFYVNDEKLTTLENDTSLSGQIGLIVAMFDKGTEATVHFDNLVIRKP